MKHWYCLAVIPVNSGPAIHALSTRDAFGVHACKARRRAHYAVALYVGSDEAGNLLTESDLIERGKFSDDKKYYYYSFIKCAEFA